MNLLLILGAGLLGSGHCIGMCGPLAITIASGAEGWRQSSLRQIGYTVGRLFTYGFFGLLAGFAGERLSEYETSLVSVPAWLAMISGVALIYLGLATLGWLPQVVSSQIGCLVAPIFRSFLKSKSQWGFLIAGMLTGFLPCGLVYAMVALAAASGSMGQGALIMIVFGLGTFPVMFATGVGGELAWGQRATAHVSSRCLVAVILTGVISISRGFSYWHQDAGLQPEACPYCTTE